MKKLNEVVVEMEEEVSSMDELLKEIAELKKENEGLVNKNEGGRKGEVLKMLKSNKIVGTKEMADKIGISSRNIGSQLSYLKKDGYRWLKVGERNGLFMLVGKVGKDGKIYKFDDDGKVSKTESEYKEIMFN